MRFEKYVGLVFVGFCYFAFLGAMFFSGFGLLGLLIVFIVVEIGCIAGVCEKRRRDRNYE